MDCKLEQERPEAFCAAPLAGAGADKLTKVARLQAVLDHFEITVAQANELVALEDYKIVVIADDSASMKKPAAFMQTRKLGETRPLRTRWQELQETITEIVDIASCLDGEGVDVFFLNRPTVFAVGESQEQQFVQAFSAPPKGGTPLSERLQEVLAKTGGEQKQVLLFILTDGEPSGGTDYFSEVISEAISTKRMKIQILACTADDEEIAWLNAVDRRFQEVDVVDDYHSERKEVLAAEIVPRFTRGDWCMKAMLGPISHKFDAWDEKLDKKKTPICSLNSCSVQ